VGASQPRATRASTLPCPLHPVQPTFHPASPHTLARAHAPTITPHTDACTRPHPLTPTLRYCCTCDKLTLVAARFRIHYRRLCGLCICPCWHKPRNPVDRAKEHAAFHGANEYHAGSHAGEGVDPQRSSKAGPAASKEKFGENYTGDGREDEINENLATVSIGVQRLKIQVRAAVHTQHATVAFHSRPSYSHPFLYSVLCLDRVESGITRCSPALRIAQQAPFHHTAPLPTHHSTTLSPLCEPHFTQHPASAVTA